MQYVCSDGNESLLEKVEFYHKDGSENVLDKETRIKYDELKRQKNIIDAINGVNFTHTYEYVTIGDRTSNLVASETYSKDGTVTCKYNYIYDEYGNIVKVKEDGKLIARYTYDGLNRLIREDNKKLDSTVVYVYDIGGNIIRKEKYSYTLEDNLGDGTSNTIYRYSDKGWNDQLVEYGEYNIEYDDLGRPESYNGNTLEWSNVRQLAQYGDNIRYTYDMNGIRIGKSILKDGNWIPGVKYYVDGNRILAQDDGNYMEFIYGVSGVEGFTLLDNVYRYRKNILGDILGIIDENNNEIVRYTYDAYGNHKIEVLSQYGYVEYDESMDYNDNRYDVETYHTISNENPFRYRGYYYDVETRLFYCNSRYYSPELCRWISSDSIEYLDPESIYGLNLYCYCYNNPISYYDPSGHSALLIGLLIFTGAMTLGGAIYGGVSAGMAGGDVGDVFAGIGKGALNGLILGGGISLAIGGFAIGGNTILGSIMATYGLSISANMLEVAIIQGKKSAYDGDDFWARANDINNAMFANSGNILIGKPTLMSIPFYGTRMTSKIPAIFNVLVSYDLDKFFGLTTFLASAKATLLSKASPLGLAAGYLLTAWQYYNLFKSIFTTPDFENSRWILY